MKDNRWGFYGSSKKERKPVNDVGSTIFLGVYAEDIPEMLFKRQRIGVENLRNRGIYASKSQKGKWL